MIPLRVRRAALSYANGDLVKSSAFIQGWLLDHPEYDSDFQACAEDSMPQVVEDWLAYKREKKQTYKTRGLAAFRKRLETLSKGDVSLARAIIEQSMASNYAGIFPLKQNSYANISTQSRLVAKAAAILSN